MRSSVHPWPVGMLNYFLLLPALFCVEVRVGRGMTHADYISQASLPVASEKVWPIGSTGRRKAKGQEEGRGQSTFPSPSVGSFSSINRSPLWFGFPGDRLLPAPSSQGS